jgi:aryl-alcohol dehydrogenase-like predicted oxidoreductase
MLERRPLGNSGLTTTPLLLGTKVFGWRTDRKAAFEILDAFVDGGGITLDTADVYSAWVKGNEGGESEAVIGEWLKASGRRNEVIVATKVGMLDGPDGKGLQPEHIASATDACLRRLGIDHIDLLFAHRDDENVPLADALGAFDALIATGKVRAIGASNYAPDRLAAALAASDADGLARFTVVEPLYNLVERAAFEGPLQDLCVAENLGVVPYFGLAKGFLTGKYRTPEDASKSGMGPAAAAYLDERGHLVLAALDQVAAEQDTAVATIALAWLAARPGIVGPIASASGIEQLPALLQAMHIRLTADQLARLDEASA